MISVPYRPAGSEHLRSEQAYLKAGPAARSTRPARAYRIVVRGCISGSKQRMTP